MTTRKCATASFHFPRSCFKIQSSDLDAGREVFHVAVRCRIGRVDFLTSLLPSHDNERFFSHCRTYKELLWRQPVLLLPGQVSMRCVAGSLRCGLAREY